MSSLPLMIKKRVRNGESNKNIRIYDIMRMNSIEMAIPCTRAGEANKYVCYKSSSAFSHKKIIQRTQK